MTDNSNVGLKHKYSKSIPLVLIVDDDLDNLLLISFILDSLSIKHLVAQNGKHAIDLAMDKVPDLILLDMVMPKINGIEITRLLKKAPQTAYIPVIAVTGLTFPEHRAEIMAAGCEDYLCKPFLIDDLEAKLTRFLNPPLTNGQPQAEGLWNEVASPLHPPRCPFDGEERVSEI